jgi:hypothetical protein
MMADVSLKIYQSVNLYTIGKSTQFNSLLQLIRIPGVYTDPIPQNGIGSPNMKYQMTAALYPGWGISPRGQGFVVTEEFRSHTVVAMLASIGGLWTILSALFSWLFGRSILFPIFGESTFCLSIKESLIQKYQGISRYRHLVRLGILC